MRLEIKRDKLELGGKEFYLAAGDMHYFRILPKSWKRHLTLMKDFGLTAVQTYVPWHLHERKKGEFDFEGYLNLRAFLELCEEVGLKVLLRPAPYVTSELDLGGIPGWVLEDADTQVRCYDPYYIECISSYYKRLCKEFVPYLSTNGGPIIAVALENEYGSFSNEKKYLNFLRDSLIENGVDVPFYTTDGATIRSFEAGAVEGAWSMVNCGVDVEEAINTLRKYQPDKPAMIGEFWDGCLGVWGSPYAPCDVEEIATAYEKALNMGAYVSFYMFSGGTNFGFTNGIHYGLPFRAKKTDPLRFITYVTSYDTDGLITEWGDTTPKYYACRDVLDKYLGKPDREDRIPNLPKQIIKDVKFTSSAGLLENKEAVAEKIIHSLKLRTMESMQQSFGYILYSTFIPGTESEDEVKLFINGLKDLALIFMDGKYIGSYLRTQGEKGDIAIKIPKEGFQLDILVENMGRPDAGRYVKERKGICDSVQLRGIHAYGWDIASMPMDDISALKMEPYKKIDGPAFYRASFKAQPGVDTFLDTKGLNKGVAWINGFNIGRYWNLGPQQTLYVPGELLKEENEIIIFEMFEAEDNVNFTDTPVLDDLKEDNPFYELVNNMQ